MDAQLATLYRYYIGDQNVGAKTAVAIADSIPQNALVAAIRQQAMEQLSQQTIDPFDTMIKEAAMSQLRRTQTSSRVKSFVTGPRGIEGPMSNLIFGGGTSRTGA